MSNTVYQFRLVLSDGGRPCLNLDDLERQIIWCMHTRIVSWFRVYDLNGNVLMSWDEAI